MKIIEACANPQKLFVSHRLGGRLTVVELKSENVGIVLPRSSLKRARTHNHGRRCLQALRQAFPARANFPKEVERVDPRGMSIAPVKMECVISYGRDRYAFKGRRNAPRLNAADAGKLLHARCARAFLTQVPGRIRSKMPVIPGNIGLDGADSLDQ
jgi:hypothetical protein